MSTVDPQELEALDLLDGIDPALLAPAASRMTSRDLPAGTTIIEEGAEAETFGIVAQGELVVSRTDGRGAGVEELAVIGPGSIVGELALLRGTRRSATVRTRTPARLVTGNRDALVALLEVPPVTAALREVVSLRLAEDARAVPVRSVAGDPLALRPLRPDDHDRLRAGIDAMSDESLYRRFFTGGRPSEAVIEHLLHVDYLDHFAWVLADPDESRGLGVARYNRADEDPAQAEVAFAVVDDMQGHGLGTLLLGALGVAAGAAGIERLRAEVLADNRPMRAVLDKAGASWSRLEPGVVVTEVAVTRATSLLDVETVGRIEAAVAEIVTAAGLALARRVC